MLGRPNKNAENYSESLTNLYKCSNVRTYILSIIPWQTCMKMFEYPDKYSDYYPMTDLYKMFGSSYKYSDYYPMTGLYKMFKC